MPGYYYVPYIFLYVDTGEVCTLLRAWIQKILLTGFEIPNSITSCWQLAETEFPL